MSMLVLPTFLGAILPIAFFCSLLFVYNRLIIDSELVSMRAAGVSQWSLAKPALSMATLIAIASCAIVMYVMPISHREFKERQFVLRSDHSALLLEEGTFNSLSDGVTVYIRGREGGTLNGILVHDARERERPVTMMAERGLLVQTAEGPRFILFNGHRQRIDRDSAELSLLNFERYTMDLGEFAHQGAPAGASRASASWASCSTPRARARIGCAASSSPKRTTASSRRCSPTPLSRSAWRRCFSATSTGAGSGAESWWRSRPQSCSRPQHYSWSTRRPRTAASFP